MNSSESANCEILRWDTAFFGFPIARFHGDTLTKERVNLIDAWCRNNGIRCLYFLSRSDDLATIRIAEDNRFKFIDIRVTLALKLSGQLHNNDPILAYQVNVRKSLPEDIEVLAEIARSCHGDSRFFYDEEFEKNAIESLYDTWIRNSCKGYADIVFVAEVNRISLGYISCNIDKSKHIGNISLIGVRKGLRGKGIGQMLLSNAITWFESQCIDEVAVVTQGRNCAAQRLYQRSGFLTQNVQLWYHKWYGT